MPEASRGSSPSCLFLSSFFPPYNPFILYSNSLSPSPFQSPHPPPLLLLSLSHLFSSCSVRPRQAVTRQLLSAEARVYSRGSSCGNCSAESGTEASFPPNTSLSPWQSSPENVPHPTVIRSWYSESQSHPTTTARQGRTSWYNFRSSRSAS
jgi:hypothetical protein